MSNNDYILRSGATTLVSQLPAYHGSDGAWVNQKDVLDTLNVIPAADVEPVRHGYWVERGNDRNPYCSECYGIGHQSPFCPHCGAKMDAKPLEE